MLSVILKKKNYKPISFFFIEKNKLKIKGFLGEIILKIPSNLNIISKDKKLIFLKKKGNFLSFEKCLKISLIGISYGWFLNLEVIGRGYSVSLQKNYLIFNVGFSHCILFFLPFNFKCKIEEKKKSKFLLFSNDYNMLKTLCSLIKKIKPINIYKGNGIKYLNEVIKLKVGKQSGN